MWTKKGIMESVRALRQLGVDCQTVNALPKNAKIKELREAWDIDRSIANGIANDITIWT